MSSTPRSSTKSGGSKRGPSKRSTRTPYRSTSSSSSSPADPVEPPPPAKPEIYGPLVVYIPPEVVNEVVNWMLLGASGFDVTQAVIERYPKLPVGDILRKAADHFRSAGVAEPAAVRGFCIESYREIYRKAVAIGDLGTALKALARLEKSAAG